MACWHTKALVTGLACSWRVGIQKRLFGHTYGSLFGGLGILPRVMPEIGNSGVVGHFGAGIRYDIKRVNIGVEWWHMSDPLNHGARRQRLEYAVNHNWLEILGGGNGRSIVCGRISCGCFFNDFTALAFRGLKPGGRL